MIHSSKFRKLLLLWICFFSANQIFAQGGGVDLTYNIGTGIPFIASDNNKVAIQADNKAIVYGDFTSYNGTSRNKIARINTDGSLDLTFNIGTGFDEKVKQVIVLPDQKLLVLGDFTNYNGATTFRICRLNTDGSKDVTFSSGTGMGGFSAQLPHRMVLHPDGKITINGNFSVYNGNNLGCAMVKINSDGSYDGSVIYDASLGFTTTYPMLLLPDGKIITTDLNRQELIKINADGSIDGSYSTALMTNANPVNTLALQSDGKIIVGIDANADGTPILKRINTDGTIDNTFFQYAFPIPYLNILEEILIEPSGKILVAGNINNSLDFLGPYFFYGLLRFKADGNLDPTFNCNVIHGRGVVLQSDNKIILTGNFSTVNSIARSGIVRLENMACPTTIPSVSIAITTGTNPFCNPGTVTFTATPTNGGAAPTYQWRKNGLNISGATNSTYTPGIGTISNGNTFDCIMVSNDPCADPLRDTSNVITMLVMSGNPVVLEMSGPGQSMRGTINQCPNATNQMFIICNPVIDASNNVTNTTTYTWTVPAGASIVSGQGNDTIYVNFGTTGGTISMVPSNGCGNGTTVSRTINMSSSTPPNLSPTAQRCGAGSMFVSCVPAPGAISHTWIVPAGYSIVSGQGSTFLNYTTDNNSGYIYVYGTNSCGNTPMDSMYIEVYTPIAATVSISQTAGTNPYCDGSTVSFTATPNGTGFGGFQWQLNGTNIAGENANVFTTNTALNGNLTCDFTPNIAGCYTSSTMVTSNTLAMITNPAVTPSVAIAAAPGISIASGTSVTFTATPTNGGTPTYQWKKNGSNIIGETASTYTGIAGTDFVDTDQIMCEMVSTAPCAAPTNATSNTLTMDVTASSPIWIFGEGLPTTNDYGNAVVKDGLGNLYLGGSKGANGFISKYDGFGNLIWSKNYGSVVNGIVINSSNNAVITGGFGATNAFGGMTYTTGSPNSTDAFVAILDINGDVTSAAKIGSSSIDLATAIAQDASGNVYITGEFNKTVDFDPSSGVFNLTSAGLRDIFVAKLDANLAFQWAYKMGSTSTDRAFGIAVGSDGVYVTGQFVGTVAGMTSAGGYDGFVIKLSVSSGTLLWANNFGSTGSEDKGSAIALDASNNVYIAGTFQNTVHGVTASGISDALILSYDMNGNVRWAKRGGSGGKDAALGIAVNGPQVLTTGYSRSGVSFTDSGILNGTSGTNDVFVVKYLTDGTFNCLRLMSGAGDQEGRAVWIETNTFALAGANNGILDAELNDLTTIPLATTGLYDPFLLSGQTCTSGTMKMNFDSILNLTSTNTSIYPNPNNGQFTVKGEGNMNIQIFNINGIKINEQNADNELSIDMKDEVSGIYLVKVLNGTNEKTFRIQVVK